MQALRIAANAAIAISCNQLRHTQIAVMNKLVSLQ